MAQQDLSDAALDARIDALRKADFTVRISTADGLPYSGKVDVELQQHDFEFGTAVSASMLGAEGVHFGKHKDITEADREKYQAFLKKYFSAVVMENIMKWNMMESEGGVERKERVAGGLYALDWAEKEGLLMRGHCLIWGGGAKWLPEWQKELAQQEPEIIEAAIRARMKRMLDRTRGRISEWDLNNEMMHGIFSAMAWAGKMVRTISSGHLKWIRK